MKFSQKEKILSLLLNTLVAIFGLWLVFYPSTGIRMFKFTMGILLLITAAILLISYFHKKNKDREPEKLLEGIVAGIVGILFLASMSIASILLSLVLVGLVLVDSIVNIRLSLIYQKFKIKHWWILLLYGIGALGLSIYLLLNLTISAKILIVITGIFILAHAIFMILNILLYKEKYYKNFDMEI